MKILYNIGIGAYAGLIRLAAAGNPKARMFCRGRKGLLRRIEKEMPLEGPVIWVHCSSVGEFEQARPVIEWYKTESPQYKIVLTFFSPSGYELRKDYPLADKVYYLPVDTPSNARRFVAAVRPEKAVFIKYEFWNNYLQALKKYGAEVYIVSAIFRPSQPFFRWYGGFFRKMLRNYTRFFVQDERSRELLAGIGYRENVTVSGDTRFDRVFRITRECRDFPLVRRFSEYGFTFVAGSTWEPDEELLADVLKHFSKVKMIIAPHEIHKEHLEKIGKLFSGFRVIRFSDFDKKLLPDGPSSGEVLDRLQEDLEQADILLIDKVGILSSLYRYGKFAYIGGGFGVGIHNILEAATYGCPVLFGPNYGKFKEACDLVEAGGAVSVKNKAELYDAVNKLFEFEPERIGKGKVCGDYVKKNLGATLRVIREIEKTSGNPGGKGPERKTGPAGE